MNLLKYEQHLPTNLMDMLPINHNGILFAGFVSHSHVLNHHFKMNGPIVILASGQMNLCMRLT